MKSYTNSSSGSGVNGRVAVPAILLFLLVCLIYSDGWARALSKAAHGGGPSKSFHSTALPRIVNPPAASPAGKTIIPVPEKALTSETKPEAQLSLEESDAMMPTHKYYEYNSRGRRDPFTSLIVPKVEAEKKRGPATIFNSEIEQMRVRAILWTNKKYYAVITLGQDGNAQSIKKYKVIEGSRVGANGGIVQKINKDSIVIKEEFKDYRGKVSSKETILKLRREEKE